MDFKGSYSSTLSFSEIIPVKLANMTSYFAFGGRNLDLNWINLFKRNFYNLSENNYEEKY
ncbi:hypothetical protein BH18THE1_BH18THE1_10900 [soil metagenome]